MDCHIKHVTDVNVLTKSIKTNIKNKKKNTEKLIKNKGKNTILSNVSFLFYYIVNNDLYSMAAVLS
jgi:hypothetical protein